MSVNFQAATLRRDPDAAPTRAAAVVDARFGHDVLDGLSHRQKTIPCTWLYDLRGSELFEDITRLDEYYPTRTEIGILTDCVTELAEHIGSGATVVEIGSGSSRKTPLLLHALHDPYAYVPVDISGEFLFDAARTLQAAFPLLRCLPMVADFSKEAEMRELARALPPQRPRVGFFPGSTIGNFTPEAAIRLLRQFGEVLGPGSKLIVGADATRDAAVLIPAYDDARGVTADFNLNLLVRINRELGGNFDLADFRHEARFNTDHYRVEMHLVCQRDVTVEVLGRRFAFTADETIHTENSYKYDMRAFEQVARSSGWLPVQTWTDTQARFGIHLLDRAV